MLSLTPLFNVDPREAFERSFDFSKFPSLQEVDFEVDWMAGDLLWIPTALSTLKHATSPRLSALQLSFTTSTTTHSVKTSIEDMGNDLRWAADEVARIEREFEGAVELTLARDPGFEAVFDALNVRFCFYGVDGTHDLVDSFFPDPSAFGPLK
jgi:hypothetical protein